MKDCPLEHYCPAENCEQCTEEDRAEIMEDINEALRPLCELLVNVLIECYPNRRVLHLAKHHPKARVRNKNLNRVARMLNA